MALEDRIFSRLPENTWRWLGVNEIKAPEGLKAAIAPELFSVAAGEERELVVDGEESRAIEVNVAAGARLRLFYAELGARSASRLRVRLGDGARLDFSALYLAPVDSVAEVTVELNGKGAAADLWAGYLLGGKEKLSANYILRTRGEETEVSLEARGVLAGDAEKSFAATLDFVRGAKGAKGRENEEVLLLSKTARNRSVPLMLSGEEAADGHHAVSVGRMDEKKLFYLKTRGLTEADARALFVRATLLPVLSRFEGTALHEAAAEFLEGRLLNA